jgi:hypothetical protein
MFRKQITIALACACLICASTTSNTAKNTTAKQPVLVARSAPQGGAPGKSRGGNQGKPGSQGNPKGGKPVATA